MYFIDSQIKNLCRIIQRENFHSFKSLIAGRCEHEENWSRFLNARKAVNADYMTDEETIPALFTKFGRTAEDRMRTNFCETVERIMGRGRQILYCK